MMKKCLIYTNIVILVCLLLIYCGSNNNNLDLFDSAEINQDIFDAAEESDLMEHTDFSAKSFYTIKINNNEGMEYEIERDLTENEIVFSFGSTHIAPAISFAMEDSIYDPTYTIITMNFGIIFGTSDHPVQTPDTGDYAFAPYPPEIRVFIKNIQYKSTVKNSSGTIYLTDWGLFTGDLFAGNFKGKILQDIEKEEKKYLNIEGNFHFILPEINPIP